MRRFQWIFYALFFSLASSSFFDKGGLIIAEAANPYQGGRYHQREVGTEAFKKLSTLEQDEILIKDFYDKLNNHKIRNTLRNAFFFCGTTPVLGLLAVGASSGELAIFSTFTGVACLQSISSMFSSFESDPLTKLEIRYIREKRFLPGSLAALIEHQFTIASLNPRSVSEAQQLITAALDLPRTIFQSEFNPERMNELFSGYQSHLRSQVDSFVFEQILMENNFKPSSLNANLENYREGKRIVGFLYGPPGAGKTRYADLISQSLGVPFAQITLAGNSIDDLIGTDSKPGLIIQALSSAKVLGSSAKNAVLFIDEADRIINKESEHSKSLLPFLLKLLDPEFKYFYSPYLKYNIDLSHLTIILAGNFMIKDEALRKRLFLIEFPGFTADYKKQIIMNTTLPKFIQSHSKNKKYAISLSDLIEQDFNRIGQLIEMDQDPGMRTIEQVLGHYLSFVSLRKHIEPNTQEPSFLEEIIIESNADVHRYINQFHEQLN